MIGLPPQTRVKGVGRQQQHKNRQTQNMYEKKIVYLRLNSIMLSVMVGQVVINGGGKDSDGGGEENSDGGDEEDSDGGVRKMELIAEIL